MYLWEFFVVVERCDGVPVVHAAIGVVRTAVQHVVAAAARTVVRRAASVHTAVIYAT